MKRIVCAVIAMMLLSGCAGAEGVSTKKWQHEAGWTAFSLAMNQEGLDEKWEKAAEAFGKRMGMKDLEPEQLKTMMLRGYSMENGVDELYVEGKQFTGRKADGTEVFSHKYSWVETLKDKNILGGTKVHVFRTKEKNAGNYQWLLLTEPVKTEGEDAEYTTFNLICTGKKDYRKLFKKGKTGSVVIPCAMIEKDTGDEGLAYAIEKLFTSSAVIK